jgi:hypothetical protein
VTTLAAKQAELAQARSALEAARYAVSYGQGDRSVTRARLPELEQHVARLAREVRELQAAAAGATSPQMITPSWR